MKIAILSDTHDNLNKIERAMDRIREHNVDYIIHAGDYVEPYLLSQITSRLHGAQFVGVFGNCDEEVEALTSCAPNNIHRAPHTFEICGTKFYLIHDISRKDMHLLSHEHDVIIYGHSHIAEIKHHNGALMINPGTCCGFMARYASFALLHLPERQAEIIKL